MLYFVLCDPIERLPTVLFSPLHAFFFVAGVGHPTSQSSGADGENSHQEQEIAQTLRQHRQQKTDRPVCQSEQRACVSKQQHWR